MGVACAGHVLHDGYTDLIWVALPIWQVEFGGRFSQDASFFKSFLGRCCMILLLRLGPSLRYDPAARLA